MQMQAVTEITPPVHHTASERELVFLDSYLRPSPFEHLARGLAHGLSLRSRKIHIEDTHPDFFRGHQLVFAPVRGRACVTQAIIAASNSLGLLLVSENPRQVDDVALRRDFGDWCRVVGFYDGPKHMERIAQLFLHRR